MTPFAAHGPVRAIQAEIGKIVIKGLTIELYEIGITPLMFSVAMIAFLIDPVVPAPVQALLCLSICRNFIVAVEAKPHL